MSIFKYTIDKAKCLRFRNRRWVPVYKNLKTRLIQQVHDSTIEDHSGYKETYANIARRYF